MDDYNLTEPRVYKQTFNRTMVAEVIAYIDDLRTIGGLENNCWGVTRKFAAGLNWLGIQDIIRKRRASTQNLGASAEKNPYYCELRS